MRDSITDVPGIRVGHAQDTASATGCTVVLCENGAVAGVDVRGGAPGTGKPIVLTRRTPVPAFTLSTSAAAAPSALRAPRVS